MIDICTESKLRIRLDISGHQGDKLVKRFNAFSYWSLSRAMDSHNVGRNRGGLEKALKSIRAKTLVLGVDSDVLFPIEEQRTLAELIPGAKFGEIISNYGHDGFLIETDQITRKIREFLSL